MPAQFQAIRQSDWAQSHDPNNCAGLQAEWKK